MPIISPFPACIQISESTICPSREEDRSVTFRSLYSIFFTVLHGCYSGFLCKQIQHSVTACKGLCVRFPGRAEIAITGPKERTATTPIIILPMVSTSFCYKSNTDCKCSDNKQRETHSLVVRTCLCGVVLHLPGFTKQNIGTVVDLFFTFLACIIKDNVFNALDTVKEIGIE